MAPDSLRTSTQGELVAVGVITGAHGIRGQVKIRSFTSNPHDIVAYGALMNKTGSKRFDLKINSETKHGLVATIKGITDRNAAELLKGQELFVDKTRMPEPDDEEFYYEELVGLEARSPEGVVLGEVLGVYDFGAGDVVEIKLVSGKQELFPFTHAIFPEINTQQGFVVANLPEIVEAKGKS
ncbi:MAG: ribosome maturation factor RimM [Rickettsiales bacterium]